MALLTRQKITEAGLTPAYAAAGAGGDTIDNADGKTYLHVKNGGGSPMTVTITPQQASTDDPKLADFTMNGSPSFFLISSNFIFF